jgi:hypothetical protein
MLVVVKTRGVIYWPQELQKIVVKQRVYISKGSLHLLLNRTLSSMYTKIDFNTRLVLIS